MKYFYLYVFLFLIGCWKPIVAQCLVGDGTEMVINGNFEQGNVGFLSDYDNCNSQGCLFEGDYGVGPNPTFFHNNFFGNDHTTGTGNAMVVNGSNVPNTEVWCQTIDVQPSSAYLFSAWVSTMVQLNPAVLQFSINGEILDAPFTAPSTLYDWQQFTSTWCSSFETTATVCIVNQNTFLQGNDFAIDDISFQPCSPVFETTVTASNPDCAGLPVVLTAAGNANAFQWSDTSAVSCDTCPVTTVFPTSDTRYTLYADYNGCSDTVTVDVDVLVALQANAFGDTTVCSGTDVSLSATGGSLYSWSPESGLSSTSGSSVAASASLSITYTVTVSDTGACPDSDTVVVIVVPGPVADAGNDTTVCKGAVVQLGGSGGVGFAWQPAASLSNPNIANPLATVDSTQTYFLTVTDANGCSDSDTTVLSVVNFNVTLTDDTVACLGDTVTLNAEANGSTSIIWSPAIGLSASTGGTVMAFVNSNVSYTVAAINLDGCVDTGSVSISVLQLPVVSAGTDTAICLGEYVQLYGTGGVTYQWLPSNLFANPNIQNPTAVVTGDQTYNLIALDENGCKGSDSVVVSALPLPHVVGSNDTIVCTGSVVTLHANNGTSYQWQPSTGLNVVTGETVTATVQNSQTYTVTAFNDAGCSDTLHIDVDVFNPAFITTPGDTVVCSGDVVILTAAGGVSYNWNGPDVNCQNCNHVPVSTTVDATYDLTALDSNECVSDLSFVVAVKDCSELAFPNAFSPNGDGLNDLFRPLHKSLSTIEIKIYNRWGQLVFTSSDLKHGWDGTFNGHDMPVGVYAWYANAISNAGNPIVLKGNVTLMR